MYPASRDGYPIAESGLAGWPPKPFTAITFSLALHRIIMQSVNMQTFRHSDVASESSWNRSERFFSGSIRRFFVAVGNHQFVKK